MSSYPKNPEEMVRLVRLPRLQKALRYVVRAKAPGRENELCPGSRCSLANT